MHAFEAFPTEGEEEEEEGEEAVATRHRVLPADRNELPTAAEVGDARAELVRLMVERFLRGGDADFIDYATIDADASLDTKETRDDAEEAYFAETERAEDDAGAPPAATFESGDMQESQASPAMARLVR